LTYLFDYADTVYIVEKDFTLALSAVNVDFVVYNTATMRVSCLGNLTNLVTLSPRKSFIFVELTLTCSQFYRSTAVSKVELESHGWYL